jgi:SAM-dependent methyltransferase
MSEALPDQQRHWTRLYARDRWGAGPSGFVRKIAPVLPERSSVLELGCGKGDDAAYLARLGHDVIACDFVEAVVAGNRERFRDVDGLTFRLMRTDGPFPDPDDTFDVVYAHLTLHYFRHGVTQAIFREIDRVLGPGELLAFVCKSDQDPLYGHGTMIEPDMFELHGHVRHFFTEAYARQCLEGAFEIEHLTMRSMARDGGTSSVVEVIARAR